MIYIGNDSTNPYYNLALEEYLLGSGMKDDILLLWQNDNTVVVGRYQNTAQEINEQFCRMHSMRVIRRNTGGGAVYHDLGNLNFSIITDYKPGDDISFARFSGVVLETLKGLGVDAGLSGRNDLVVGGLKISGGAQTILGGRILHHGTLLCCSDLDILSGALKSDPGKISSNAVESVRSRVANIRDFNSDITVGLLKDRLLSEFSKSVALERYELTGDEVAAVRSLQSTKYDTWLWNYGASPAFEFIKSTRFPQGTVEISLTVEDGFISKCAINGDFLGCMDISDVEQALVGTRRHISDVEACIERFDAGLYFGGIPAGDVVCCFFD